MRDKAGVDWSIYPTGDLMVLTNENMKLDEPVLESAIEKCSQNLPD